MMTQYCQQCYKPVEFADGSTIAVPCPSCGARVVPSTGYTPSVGTSGGVPAVSASPSVPVPPVPPVNAPTIPTPPPGLKAPAEATNVSSGKADTAHGYFGLTLNPTWLTWIPLGCLAACFFLLFFTWVDVNLGGYSVMSQSAWNTMGGNLHANWPAGEEWTTLEKTLAGTNDSRKEATLRTDGFMVIYLLALFLALPLLVADRLFTTLDDAKLPASMKWLPGVWKYRVMVSVGLLVLMLFLVAFQSLQRFGLEKALYRNAETAFKLDLEKATTDSERKAVYIKIGQEAGKYPANTTIWVSVVVFLHTLAVLAMLAREWLYLRGEKPLPRLGFSW